MFKKVSLMLILGGFITSSAIASSCDELKSKIKENLKIKNQLEITEPNRESSKIKEIKKEIHRLQERIAAHCLLNLQ